MKITVADVTSLRSYWESVAAWRSDIVILADTRLTQAGQRIIGRLARRTGWQEFWGEPVPSRGGGVWPLFLGLSAKCSIEKSTNLRWTRLTAQSGNDPKKGGYWDPMLPLRNAAALRPPSTCAGM